MMRVLVALLVLLLSTTPVEATIFWISGVETGTVDVTTGEFGGTNSGATAVTSPVRSGAYALSTTSGSFIDTITGIGVTRLQFRDYIYMTANPSSDAIVFQTMSNVPASRIQILVRTDGTLAWALAGGAVIAGGATAITLGTWNLIEADMLHTGINGGTEVKLNNVSQFSSFSTNTTGVADRVRIGPSTGGGQTIIHDDMFLTDAGFPGPGRNIARQGVAGSPTYQNWSSFTGTGCAASTPEVCWSQTPFDSSFRAGTSVVSSKQTMMVWPFNLAQTGHGSDLVRSNDTVNACKAAYYTGGTGGDMTLIRIVGGSETGTLTSPGGGGVVYVDDATMRSAAHAWTNPNTHWTTTTANLTSGTLEIGGNPGGSTPGRIDDMWIICDVTGSNVRHRVPQ